MSLLLGNTVRINGGFRAAPGEAAFAADAVTLVAVLKGGQTVTLTPTAAGGGGWTALWTPPAAGVWTIKLTATSPGPATAETTLIVTPSRAT